MSCVPRPCSWDAESATSAPVTVTWIPVRGFTVALASDITDFDTVGTVITYTATVTNTGNQADTPDSVTVGSAAGHQADTAAAVAADDVTLSCTPSGSLAPAATTTCTGKLTTSTGADVTRTATVTWGEQSATSEPVTVTWVGALAPTHSPSPSASPSPGVVSPDEDALAATGGLVLGVLLLGAVLLAIGVLLKGLTTRDRSPRHPKAH